MLGITLGVLSTIIATTSNAHIVGRGCGGHELHLDPRHLEGRQNAAPTDVPSANAITDPVRQCTPYSYPPMASIQANYPTMWTTATIPAADSEARSIFEAINKTVNEKLPGAGLKPATGVAGYNYDRSDPDCWWSWQGCTTPNPSLGLPADIYRIPEPQTLGLTVDDGPNCSQNAFYDFLRQQNQKVSMFFIGSNVMIWPLQAKRAFDDGHEICVHTWSHQLMTSLTNEQVFAELYYTRKIIKDLIGITPKCWRPPQGDVDNRVRMIAAGLNLTNILWVSDTDDWRAQAPGSTTTPADVDKNYQNVVDQAKGGNFSTQGTILLTHQSTNYTMSTLMKWIPQLRSAFAHVVPVASAMNWTQPYAEMNYTYPSFAQIIANQSASPPGQLPSSSSGGSNSPGANLTATQSASGTNRPSGNNQAASPSGSSRAAGLLTRDVGFGGFLIAGLLAWATI